MYYCFPLKYLAKNFMIELGMLVVSCLFNRMLIFTISKALLMSRANSIEEV